MSWYSWMIVMACAATKYIRMAIVVLFVSRLVSIWRMCFVSVVVVGLPASRGLFGCGEYVV
jgi:hypothetical protein